MNIGLVVEGHGDETAIPVLVRRILLGAGVSSPIIPKPVRCPRDRLVKREHFENALVLAARNAPDGVVVVVCDADRDCPAELGQTWLAWAKEIRVGVPCSAVLAKVEFEAWFLAAAESLRGRRGLPFDLTAPPTPESIRDAKGWLSKRMESSYRENIDQQNFAAVFDWPLAATRAPSLAKLVRDLGRLAEPFRQI